MPNFLRRAGSKESAATDSENMAPAQTQRKFSKQALAFMSMGSDRGPNSGAPGSTRASGALSDITNMLCSNQGMPRKSSKEAAFNCVQEYPADAAATSAAEGVVASHPRASSKRSARQSFVPEEHSSMFENDHADLFRCAEHAPDIFAAYFRSEAAKMPRATYMDAQQEVNPKMRGILIDWLQDVHTKLKMQIETLYLTVNIIDRYMSLRQVKRRQLQLLGVVALFTAAKYEERDPPKAATLAYLTDHAHTRGDVIDFEFEVLNALGCEVVVATPASFLDRLSRANGCEPRQRALVSYLVELSLTEMRMIRHLPSQLVSAAILLSNDLLRVTPRWSAAMAHHSRHSEVELQPIAEELRELFLSAPANSLQAVRRKYQSEKNHCVADLSFRCL